MAAEVKPNVLRASVMTCTRVLGLILSSASAASGSYLRFC